MRKFAIVLTALVATLFVGTTAHAQNSHNRHRGNTSVDVHINGGGFGIGIHSGNRGGWDRGGWDRRGPVYRPDYRRPDYRNPAPVYRDPCGYDYRCNQPSTITITVRETCVDRYGQLVYTGRIVYRTAYYDSNYGGYVYRDESGRLIRAR